MNQPATKPARDLRRVDAAIQHLESVARLCRLQRGQVIPFPPERSRLYR